MLRAIAAARRALRIDEMIASGADLDAIADALKHPNAHDKPSYPSRALEAEWRPISENALREVTEYINKAVFGHESFDGPARD